MKTNFLVAYDFTKTSESAVEHALMTAEKMTSNKDGNDSDEFM